MITLSPAQLEERALALEEFAGELINYCSDQARSNFNSTINLACNEALSRAHALRTQARSLSATDGVAALPHAYICPVGCGCLWRDNRDGTMSLFNGKQISCAGCEPLPLSCLRPLYAYPPLPAGFVAVPREPTEEMERAGEQAVMDVDTENTPSQFIAEIAYKAMLAAAPDLPKQGSALQAVAGKT